MRLWPRNPSQLAGALAFACALIALGCGGGGGGAATTGSTGSTGTTGTPGTTGTTGGGQLRATPQLSVSWPERTREVTSPNSAMSARFILHDNSGSLSDIILDVNRSSNLNAHTDLFSFSSQAPVGGGYTLSGSFYANLSLGAPLVGTVSAPVAVASDGTLTKPDGSPLGVVSFVGVVRSVGVAANQTVQFHQTRQLTATAMDAAGNPLVLPIGAFHFSVAAGNANLSVTPDGLGTANAIGSADIVAEVDGVSSSATTVFCVPVPLTTLALAANDLAFDSVGQRLVVAVRGNGQSAPGVVLVDPATAQVTGTYTLPADPNLVAVTDDGQFAYCAMPSDGTVRRLDLATGSWTTQSTPGLAVDLATVPGSPHAYVVAADPTGGVNLSVYDDGVRRTGTGTGGSHIVMASGTQLYGSGNGSLFYDTLSPTSITWTDQVDGLIDADVLFADGLLYTGNGKVVDPNTKTAVGQLPTTNFLFEKVPALSPAEDRVYFVTWDAGLPRKILIFDKTTRAELPLRDLGVFPGGCKGLTACGNKTVAFYTTGTGVTPQLVIVRNLP